MFLDLSKAFDTIDHRILIYKLKKYGIRGSALSFFQNYLSNRKQYVALDSNNSCKTSVTCGVPQGSILGPLLFLLYVNDLTRSSRILTFILFADDTNIFLSHKCLDTLVDILNLELRKVSSWFKCNKLSLNIDKTCFIHFKNPQSQSNCKNIFIDDIPIVQKESTKFLGVTLDSSLSWTEQTRNITTTLSKVIGILYKLKNILPQKTLIMLYNALVLPHINYCNIVWANCNKTKLNSILLLQKRALRICTNSHYLSHADPLFKQIKTQNSQST